MNHIHDHHTSHNDSLAQNHDDVDDDDHGDSLSYNHDDGHII